MDYMHLQKLIQAYEKEREHRPQSPDQLLDYCQQQYIKGQLDSQTYRQLFQQLHNEGAQTSHKEVETV